MDHQLAQGAAEIAFPDFLDLQSGCNDRPQCPFADQNAVGLSSGNILETENGIDRITDDGKTRESDKTS